MDTSGICKLIASNGELEGAFPHKIESPVVKRTKEGIVLSWNKHPDDSVEYFIVEMAEVGNPYEEIYRGKEQKVEKQLPLGEYDFRVVTVNDIGPGKYSDDISVNIKGTKDKYRYNFRVEPWTWYSNGLMLSNNNLTATEQQGVMQAAISNQSLIDFSEFTIKVDKIVGHSGWVGVGLATDDCLQKSFDGSQQVWMCSFNSHVWPTDQVRVDLKHKRNSYAEDLWSSA